MKVTRKVKVYEAVRYTAEIQHEMSKALTEESNTLKAAAIDKILKTAVSGDIILDGQYHVPADVFYKMYDKVIEEPV